jgi:hypothetical protein
VLLSKNSPWQRILINGRIPVLSNIKALGNAKGYIRC